MKVKFIYTKNRTYKCTKCGWEYKELPPASETDDDNGCPNCWLLTNTKGKRDGIIQ